MSEYVSKKFTIYEYTPGAVESITVASRREEIMLDVGNRIGIIGIFYYSDEIEPAVECEMRINAEAISDEPDCVISEQVQQVLYFGIGRTNGIIPERDNPEYAFNRHGAEITNWIIREIHGKPPIGFHVR